DINKLGFCAIAPLESGENAKSVGKRCAEFLQSQKSQNKPFYLQIGFRETHTPFVKNGANPENENGIEVPPYLADDEGNRATMAAFQGAVNMVDQGVEQILQGL